MSSSSDQVLDGSVLQQSPTNTYKKNIASTSFSTIQLGDSVTQNYAGVVTSTGITIDPNPPINNLINSKKLCVYRPESIAMLDFKSAAEGNFLGLDTTSKLFNERVLKRKIQLESVINSIDQIKISDPDLYNNAVSQYEAAIASAAAEIALLKIAYQFKVYAEIGPSFTSWIKNYQFDPFDYGEATRLIPTGRVLKSDTNPEFIRFMNKSMGWKSSGFDVYGILKNTLENGKDATLFLQFISDLAFSCCFGTPSMVLGAGRFKAESTNLLFSTDELALVPKTNTKVVLVTDGDGSKELRSLDVSKSGLIRLSRDLTASYQIGKIAIGAGDENQELKSMLQRHVESDFFSKTTKFNKSLFGKIAGWDPYGAAVPDISKRGSNSKLKYYLPDFTSYESGIISKLFTSDFKTLIISSESDSYQSRESSSAVGTDYYETSYAGVKDLVQEAFSSNNTGINLGLYNNTISGFQNNLEDFSNIFLQLFKLLDKSGTIKASDSLLSENFHPTSPAGIYKSVMKVYSERFAPNVDSCIGLNPSTIVSKYGLDPENIGQPIQSVQEKLREYNNDFAKCWGIFLMIKFPETVKKIIEKFVEDYKRGYLTFSDTVIIEENDETGEEKEIRNNVLPGSETVVDLSGKRGSLYSYLQLLHKDFVSEVSDSLNSDIDNEASDFAYMEIGTSYKDGSYLSHQYSGLWAPMSPTRAFTGTYNLEKYQAESFGFNYLQNIELLFNNQVPSNDLFFSSYEMINQQFGNISLGGEGGIGRDGDMGALASRKNMHNGIVFNRALQNNCIWWAENEAGVVYPAAILPIAAGAIDAVMTVLYECLSENLQVLPVSAADSVWPSIDSKNPPYSKEYEVTSCYRQSVGSFDGNLSYWVPVLNALKENVVRSEDLTTYFGNNSLASILSGVVDAFATSDELFSSNFTMMTAGVSSKDQVEGSAGAVPITSMTYAWDYTDYGNDADNATYNNNIAGGSSRKAWSASVRSKGDGNSINTSVQGNEYTGSGIMAGINWSSYLDTQEILGGNSGGAGDNAYVASISSNITEYTSYIAGYGIWVFGALESALPSASTITPSDATPSMWLDKTSSSQNWQDVVTSGELFALNMVGLVSAFYFLAAGLATADSEDQINDIMASFENIQEFLSGLISGSLLRVEELSGLNDVPTNIWQLACYSGNLDSDATSSPMRKILDLSLTDLVNYVNSPESLISEGGILDVDGSSSAHYDYSVGNQKLSASLYKVMSTFLDYAAEDVRLGVALDMIRNYGERIEKYSETAVDGLSTEEGSEESSLEKLISDLSKTVAGNDVLENLTPRQLSLKSATLERQKSLTENAYISNSEIISDSEISAIRVLLSEPQLLAEEGRNAKTFVVGFSAGMFDAVAPPENSMNYQGPTAYSSTITPLNFSGGKHCPLYGLRYQVQVPDYPLISFIPKLFRFDYELFVLSGAFDNVDFDAISNFNDLVRQTEFTRIRYLTVESSPGSTEQITKIDSSSKEILSNMISIDSPGNSHRYDIYANTLSSYLLEKYYKLLIGLSASEDDLGTAGGGLSIPINEYAVDLSAALSSIYTDLESGLSQEKIDNLFMKSSDIESLSYNALRPDAESNISSISKYSDLVSSFSAEIESGEFTNIDLSAFESFTNASSSRLFSAESMRDKIIAAKYFDRINYVLVDPDEFLIASTNVWEAEIARKGGEVSAYIVDRYSAFITELVALGKIVPYEYDEIGNVVYYKMSPRPDEGDLSFASVFSTLIRSHSVQDPYQKSLRPEVSADLIINTVEVSS